MNSSQLNFFNDIFRFQGYKTLFFTANGFYTHFFYQTLNIGSLLILIGLFINFKKSLNLNQKKLNLILFIKCSIIIVFCLFTINIFLYPSFTIPTTKRYLNFFSPRIFELFSGFWIILLIYSINVIKNFLGKLLKKFNGKRTLKKKYLLLKSIYLIIFFSFLGGLYITNFERIWVGYERGLNSDQCDCYLYAGNYFYQKSYKDETGIYIQTTRLRYTYLIFNPELEIYLFNFTYRLSYNNFIIDFLNNNSKYVIFNISTVNNEFLNNFMNDFKILYKNDGNYTFGEYIV
ncbi:MAG: hypothetical protein ACTSVV_05335 [Promethearchaeota archaeon]